jgi:hypothetical protein
MQEEKARITFVGNDGVEREYAPESEIPAEYWSKRRYHNGTDGTHEFWWSVDFYFYTNKADRDALKNLLS